MIDDNTELEIARMELEMVNVEAAKKGMEFKIKERELDIKRILGHIDVQNKRVEEIKVKIHELKGGK